MSYLLAVLCIALMVLSLMLILLSLPGTWVILAISALWSFFSESPAFTWQFFALLGVLALLGELVEFGAGYYGAKNFGGSTKGSLGGIIGALVGGIMGAPLFFGLGALPGALGGAFAGCFIMETMNGMAGKAAARAALGTTLGRFGGFVAKLGIGIGMIWLSAPRVWGSL